MNPTPLCPTPARRLTLAVALALAAAGPGLAAAQSAGNFPERPITVIVPFSAGAGTDQTARLLARSLEKHGKQPVVVVNRPGAGGAIGMNALAASAPDGYTLGILNTPNMLTIPIERPERFDLNSFELLANLVDDPGTFSVHVDSPWKDLKQLIAHAKANPDTLTYGTAGIGSAGHISMLLFQRAADIKLRHVPFKGTADVATALLGKQIDVATANLGEALGFARNASWRTLGQMKASRSPMAASLPTFAEQGYALEGGSLRGLGAPKGVPADTLKQLQALLDKALTDEEFLQAAKNANQDVRYLPSGPYAQTLATMNQQFQQIWKETPWNQ